jgi:anti-sigma B factor antagonist
MLKIDRKVENGTAVIAPEGRLDTVTAPEMEAAVRDILPEITELILDFGKLEYISSAGLRVLLSSQKAMNGRGTMKVRNVNETIGEVFEITGFSDILNIE